MFTGIVTQLGDVKRAAQRNGALQLRVATPLARELRVGDSIAVNGVCL
ncbi:MAG TPA: riboflavin synthase, partial [Actinomycetota bacterium]|nr:riboflavin synthase [Actinomycetota bacterium]